MSTITAHISRGATRRTLAAAIVVAAIPVASALAVFPAGARASSTHVHGYAYGWPVKPFDKQHPVRGFFGDPRVGVNADGSISRQFHFGVDVSAPDGTAVYATMDGRLSIHPDHPDVVLLDGPAGVEFSYWHVIPSIHDGEQAVAYQTVVGHVERPWGHVHFSEMVNGVYLNPLRPGAMGPYSDTTRPVVSALELERTGDAAHIRPATVSGTVDLVAEVADTTPLAVPEPWHAMPVMPALVRWRIVGRTGPVGGWHTAVDFRSTIPPASAFSSVFALWTRQNHPNHPGRYRVYLAHAWSCAQLSSGWYRVQIETSDTRDNTTVAEFPIRIEAGR
jgi:hypothetical protein